jgi:hypothetical protein
MMYAVSAEPEPRWRMATTLWRNSCMLAALVLIIHSHALGGEAAAKDGPIDKATNAAVADAIKALDAYRATLGKIVAKTTKELERLKVDTLKTGDLSGANAIAGVLTEMPSGAPIQPVEPAATEGDATHRVAVRQPLLAASYAKVEVKGAPRWIPVAAGSIIDDGATNALAQPPTAYANLEISVINKHQGVTSFTAVTAGVIRMVVSTRWGGGGGGGPWQQECITEQGMLDAGWKREEDLPLVEGAYAVFSKTAIAGEAFSIRTEKYTAPKLLRPLVMRPDTTTPRAATAPEPPKGGVLPASVLPASATALLVAARPEVAKAQAVYHGAIAAAMERALKDLDKAKSEAMKRGDLTTANACQQRVDQVRNERWLEAQAQAQRPGGALVPQTGSNSRGGATAIAAPNPGEKAGSK